MIKQNPLWSPKLCLDSNTKFAQQQSDQKSWTPQHMTLLGSPTGPRDAPWDFQHRASAAAAGQSQPALRWSYSDRAVSKRLPGFKRRHNDSEVWPWKPHLCVWYWKNLYQLGNNYQTYQGHLCRSGSQIHEHLCWSEHHVLNCWSHTAHMFGSLKHFFADRFGVNPPGKIPELCRKRDQRLTGKAHWGNLRLALGPTHSRLNITPSNFSATAQLKSRPGTAQEIRKKNMGGSLFGHWLVEVFTNWVQHLSILVVEWHAILHNYHLSLQQLDKGCIILRFWFQQHSMIINHRIESDCDSTCMEYPCCQAAWSCRSSRTALLRLQTWLPSKSQTTDSKAHAG